jgi:hypothetical protein
MTQTQEPGRKHWMDTGQDWTSDSFTEDEYKAMADWYATVHGEGNLDLTQFIPFMLNLRPDSLKLYRRWVETVPAGRSVENGINDPAALVWQHYYGTNAYREGYLYEVIMAREFGATKAEVAQTTVLSWLHGGPLGLNSAAAAAIEYMENWDTDKDDSPGLTYPDGWAPDPDAFRSGIDLDPDKPFTPEDLGKLSDWHRRVQGEVPDYVPVLAEFNGGALKLWRARYENAAVGPLPKQFIALLQVHQAMMMRQPQALRRATHMAKYFGATKAQVGQMLGSVQVYLGDLGMEAIGAVRPLLDAWDSA